MSIGFVVPVVFVILALHVILAIVGLRDIGLPERAVRGGSKLGWAVVVGLGLLIGPLVYLLFGREE